MTTSFEECKRCRWEYMQEMSFVRRQPWTEDDAGLMFQTCDRCGQISIQRFDNEGLVTGVWILHPDSVVMFRSGTAPSHIFDYVISEDFLKNRGVTRGLFRGHLKSMLDLSGAVNVLISHIKRSNSLQRVELCMELFRDLLFEYSARSASTAEDRRLAVSTLFPLIELVHESRDLEGSASAARVDLRFAALEVLETFLQPGMDASAPAAEAAELEAAIDHLQMVDRSIARMNRLAQEINDDAIVTAFVESRFLYRVFRRRKARLSRAHSEAVWRLMFAVSQHFPLGSPLDFSTKAYESLRGLLEHQAVELGFFKLGPRNQNGTPCLAFRGPNTGEILLLPLYYPKLAIYATDGAQHPTAVLDSWVAALDRL